MSQRSRVVAFTVAASFATVVASEPARADELTLSSSSSYRCPGLVTQAGMGLRFWGSDSYGDLGVGSGSASMSAGSNTPLSGNGGGSGGSILSGVDSAEGLLIAAVITAAALPLVVYAVDESARYDIEHCWALPTENFEVQGGALLGRADWAGTLRLHGSVTAGFLGLDVAGEGSREGFGYRSFDASVLFRAPPRQHMDLAFGAGYRSLQIGGLLRQGAELSLPHRYLPFREDALIQGVALEVKPAVFLHRTGLDLRLDAGLGIPVTEYLKLYLGGRAFSFNRTVHLGASVGLSAGG